MYHPLALSPPMIYQIYLILLHRPVLSYHAIFLHPLSYHIMLLSLTTHSYDQLVILSLHAIISLHKNITQPLNLTPISCLYSITVSLYSFPFSSRNSSTFQKSNSTSLQIWYRTRRDGLFCIHWSLKLTTEVILLEILKPDGAKLDEQATTESFLSFFVDLCIWAACSYWRNQHRM